MCEDQVTGPLAVACLVCRAEIGLSCASEYGIHNARILAALSAAEAERDKWLAGYKDEIDHAAKLVAERGALAARLAKTAALLDEYDGGIAPGSAEAHLIDALRAILADPVKP